MNDELEMLDSPNELNKFVVSNISIGFLKETAKWAKLLSIIGFVSIGLFVVGGVVFSPFISYYTSFTMSSAVFIIIGLIYFFPTLYLYKFSIRTKKAINSRSSPELELAFENLKSYYKFKGIFTIISITIYLIIFILSVFSGAFYY